MGWVAIILAGALIALIGPPALAIWLCERHANQYATSVARAYHLAELESAEQIRIARHTSTREKELTRR